ncbi:MAG: hypothetical protein IJN82_00900 [Clostridia bacterium]|nr:hypothetical protein [Clostridia bacterium]MBQ7089656.1 hypothetical protein [Clostridia bacterium]
MIRILGFISLGIALLFVVLLIVSLCVGLKKKSLKVRKQIIARRRLYGVVAGLFLVLGVALWLLGGSKPEWKLFQEGPSAEEAYQQLLSATDEEGALDALPEAIFAVGDDYYVKTPQGNVYGYVMTTQKPPASEEDEAEEEKPAEEEPEEKEGEEETEEKELPTYQKGLCFVGAEQVSGGGNLLAVRDREGVLRLNGAFEYLTYENDDTVFEDQVYSEACSFAEASGNDLFYVENGDLYSVGYNKFGKLGDGTERNRLEGAMILKDVASVSSSETHTLVVDAYGNLYGFGDNSYSEMGNRTTAGSSTPEKLMGGVKQAQAGRYFSIVLTKNGEVYAAGRNDKGQLGTGDDRSYATYMKILDGVMKISVKGDSCAALTSKGVLYVWGSNAEKQLGAGKDYLIKPTEFAKDVYDMAMGQRSLGMIKLNRDVAVTGAARPVENKEFQQYLYQFEATVPEEHRYRENIELPVKTEKKEKNEKNA